MPTPFVADAADEAVRSESILNERKAADIIEETALEVDIRAWRAEGLRLLQAASAREDHVPNGARRPCSVLGDASAQAAIEDAVTRMSRTEGVPQRPPRALGSTLAPEPEPPSIPVWKTNFMAHYAIDATPAQVHSEIPPADVVLFDRGPVLHHALRRVYF